MIHIGGTAFGALFFTGIFAQVTTGGWLELKQRVTGPLIRPLRCPLCKHRFTWRTFQSTGKLCPKCKVPLGAPYWYRVLLVFAYLCAAGYVMYWGCRGPDANGWLLAGLPFAFIAGIAAQVVILRMFPPKLAPHAEGSTWLKLSD